MYSKSLLRVGFMETQPDVALKSKSGLARFLSHPITGFVVGIIGIVLAIYFYYAGRTEPKLILLLHPIRSPIVQTGRLSDLSVSLHGKPINGDLTAAQFILWNSGKAPVRHEDILKPIILMTASNCPIYEATIRNVSRDVVGFQLVTNDMASGRLGFDWKILEHNDGASIQILYGGSQKLAFLENGATVVGQRFIPFQILNVSNTNLKQEVGATVVLGFLAWACMSGLKDYFKKFRKALREGKKKNIVDASGGMIFTGGLTILFCLLIFYIFVGNNAPPFGF